MSVEINHEMYLEQIAIAMREYAGAPNLFESVVNELMYEWIEKRKAEREQLRQTHPRYTEASEKYETLPERYAYCAGTDAAQRFDEELVKRLANAANHLYGCHGHRMVSGCTGGRLEDCQHEAHSLMILQALTSKVLGEEVVRAT